MTSRNEVDYLWLITSPAMKILREGQRHRDIFVPLMDLYDSDRTRYDELHAICARLEFVEQLKYASTLRVAPYQERAAQYQLDRLLTYLTLTCVDVAAGRGHKEFIAWLIAEMQERSPRENISNLVNALVSTDSPELVHNILGSELQKLYLKDYLDEEGIGRKFKRFLSADLPEEWLKDWLSDVYVILKGDEFPPDTIGSWFERDVLERCELIAEHLYETRIKYTHTVEYHPDIEDEESGVMVLNVGGKQYGFSSFHKDGDIRSQTTRNVGVKRGLIESNIIRLIVVIHLRKELEIKTERSLIDTFLKRASYRRFGYSFLRELHINFETIQQWCADHSLVKDYAPIVLLAESAATEFIKLDKQLYRGGDFSFSNPDSYLEHIEKINQQIATIKESIGEKGLSAEEINKRQWKALEALVGPNDWHKLIMEIHQIYFGLFRRLNEHSY